MFDLGYFKLPFFFASCLLVAATFLVAQCTEYWHFLLCQGFAVGVREDYEFILYLGSQGNLAWLWDDIRACHGRYFSLVQEATWTCARFHGSRIKYWGYRISDSDQKVDQRSWVCCNETTSFLCVAGAHYVCIRFQWTMRILGFILILTLGCANLVSTSDTFRIVVSLDIHFSRRYSAGCRQSKRRVVSLTRPHSRTWRSQSGVYLDSSHSSVSIQVGTLCGRFS